MEEGILSLWTLVHIFSGVVLAFLFSLKKVKLIEFAGLLALPFIFLHNPPVQIVSLVIVFISGFAFVVKRVSKKKDGFSLVLDIILTLFLLILWELAEYLTYPITHFGEESLLNRTSDIIFGFAGFLITYPFLHRARKRRRHKRRKNHNNP